MMISPQFSTRLKIHQKKSLVDHLDPPGTLDSGLLYKRSRINTRCLENIRKVVIEIRFHFLERIVVIQALEDKFAARILRHSQHSFHDHSLQSRIKRCDELHA